MFLTTADGNALQVLEFQRSADPNVADPATARLILSIPHTTASNHNGGQLQFGPDGFLYVSTGDGGNTPAMAQDLGSELGKVLRIDARTGTAAPGNPFGSRVWSWGLRNPWRFTFDRGTGDLLIGDVGQSAREEVNWATAATGRGPGANFGWPCREGDIAGPGAACAGATTDPAFARTSADGFHAIVGGYVVRDPGLPTLYGRYLYGDAAIGSLRSVTLPNTDDRAEPMPISALSSFGEDACGRIYAASLSGPVYRVQDGAPTPCTFPAPAPVATVVDTVAPGLRVRLLRPALDRRRLRLALRCDEACRVAISARLRGVRRLSTRHRSLAANTRTVVALKLSRSHRPAGAARGQAPRVRARRAHGQSDGRGGQPRHRGDPPRADQAPAVNRNGRVVLTTRPLPSESFRASSVSGPSGPESVTPSRRSSICHSARPGKIGHASTKSPIRLRKMVRRPAAPASRASREPGGRGAPPPRPPRGRRTRR